MKINKTSLVVFFSTAFLFSTTPLSAQENTLARLQTDLISPWLVTIKDQGRTLVLTISAVKQRDEESFALDASFGFINGNPRPVDAEVIQTAKERKLLFNTQSGNRYVVTQTSNGTFEGSYTSASGNTTPVSVEKLSETELLKAQSRISAAAAIVKPAADVPASCAAFSGKWTGTWGYGIGQQWLWVASIDTKCLAKIAYLESNRTPTSYEMVGIKDGALEWLCNKSTNGTCVLTRHGDDLWARYSNPSGGTNRAVFTKIE